jgi:hypothetical protein
MAHAGGRPTDYKDDYNEQAYKLCLLGAIDKELADFFSISESTLNLWKQEHEEFSESIKRGKMDADANVADKLYQRATGYEHAEDQIFQYQGMPVIVPTTKHYAPDPTAAIFWLKNRQRDKWRDRQEIETTSKTEPLTAADKRKFIEENKDLLKDILSDK